MTMTKQVNMAEVIARARQRLFSPEVRFNWRPHGVTRYESAWSMLHKFSYLNKLSRFDMCTMFGGREYWPSLSRPTVHVDFHLRAFDRSSLARLQYLLKIDQTTAYLSLIEPYRFAQVTAASNLRFCEACIENGFHSPLFQIDAVVRCPIHLEVLRTQCRCCKQPIPYQINERLLVYPYACPSCHSPLWSGMLLPEWTPGITPKDAKALAQYLRWSETIIKAVRGEFFHVADIRSEWERDRAANRLPGYLCDIKPMRDFPSAALQRDLDECRVTVSATHQIPYVRIHCRNAGWWQNAQGERIDRHHDFLNVMADEYYAIYKSVRRYLKRRYLRPRHHLCHTAYRRYVGLDSFRCHWGAGFVHWESEWGALFRGGELARLHWLRGLEKRADYLLEIAAYIDGGEAITHPTRDALRWLGARWLGMTVLVSFYRAFQSTSGGREHLPSVDWPYLRWEPADGIATPHRVTWWMRPVAPLLDQIRHLDLHDGDFAAFRKGACGVPTKHGPKSSLSGPVQSVR